MKKAVSWLLLFLLVFAAPAQAAIFVRNCALEQSMYRQNQATDHNSDYGVTTQTSGDKNLYQPLLYTHCELDAETGFYHNRARHYAPKFGKFLARDPIANSNLYSYCHGDPINFSDPSGLDTGYGGPNGDIQLWSGSLTNVSDNAEIAGWTAFGIVTIYESVGFATSVAGWYAFQRMAQGGRPCSSTSFISGAAGGELASTESLAAARARGVTINTNATNLPTGKAGSFGVSVNGAKSMNFTAPPSNYALWHEEGHENHFDQLVASLGLDKATTIWWRQIGSVEKEEYVFQYMQRYWNQLTDPQKSNAFNNLQNPFR